MAGNIFLMGNIRSADWEHQYLADLSIAFTELGRPNKVYLVGDASEGPSRDEISVPGSFIVDVNNRAGTADYPKLSWICDHPLSHLHLANPGQRTVLAMIDRGHAALASCFDAPVTFIPHGGSEPDPDALTAERDIDVLFVGNVLDPHVPCGKWEELAVELGEHASHRAVDPFDVLNDEVRRSGESMPRETIKALLDIATCEAQRLARTAAISSVSGCRFHVVGQIPAALAESMADRAVIHGFNASFMESLRLMRRSKVVINVAQKFPHGSHERIWYGMATGAAVISNHSSFVAEDFTHGENILFYEDPAQVGDLVQQALARARHRDLAAAALPVYVRGHTWMERAERILVAMAGRGV